MKKAFLLVQMVKNIPAMQEAQVRSLGQEDPQEKGMATHSGILAWRIPRTEQPGRLQSMGHKESDTTELLTLNFLFTRRTALGLFRGYQCNLRASLVAQMVKNFS